jgi:predicted ABC-type sugar transport system permease subunit
MAGKLFVINEGGVDRAVRVILGIVLLSLTVVGPKTWWGLIGILPLATGLTGICLLYTLFGIDTRPKTN